MLIKRAEKIKPSEITSEQNYFGRRELMKMWATAGVCAPLGLTGIQQAQAAELEYTQWPNSLTDPPTPEEKATTHNNFYELGTSKGDPSKNADYYQSRPWKVMIDGEVNKPGEMDIEDIMALAPLQERIYRLRCVEAWSMVIPWIGFPLSKLMDVVEPNSNAKYVAFQTFNPNNLFPDKANRSLPWPYAEGLRIDEAAHDLTLLTFGMYGKLLPNQNGAPVRLVVPWKYGYKSIKAIVRISFVSEQPPTAWNDAQPQEYGFYSNVNPEVSHPRWTQAEERSITDAFFPVKRPTDMFNGYEEVASLYTGMDLKVNH